MCLGKGELGLAKVQGAAINNPSVRCPTTACSSRGLLHWPYRSATGALLKLTQSYVSTRLGIKSPTVDERSTAQASWQHGSKRFVRITCDRFRRSRWSAVDGGAAATGIHTFAALTTAPIPISTPFTLLHCKLATGEQDVFAKLVVVIAGAHEFLGGCLGE